MKKEGILFVYPRKSSFVTKDIEILNHKYHVYTYEFSQSDKILLPVTFLKQILFLLFRSGHFSRIIIQFGGYHSFLPVFLKKILRKRVIIIAGGIDCVAYPELNYGYMHQQPISWFTKYSFRHCDLILPKHHSLIASDDCYNYPQLSKQGLKNHIRNFKTPIQEIPNGFDGELFRNVYDKKIPASFVTVATGLEVRKNFVLKGIDLVFEIAKKFPQATFHIVGGDKIDKSNPTPPNMELLPIMEPPELIYTYSKYRYYLQLSISEGFPNALCEAMLCECIPIGSAIGAIPDIIGDTGYVLKEKKMELLVQIIEKALHDPKSETGGKLARQRIIEKYSIEKRATMLLKSLE